jgi:hypothetical protein
MGRSLSVIVLLAAFQSGVLSEYKVDWPALERAYVAYIQHPSQTTADKVQRLLPPGSADRHVGVFNVDAAERIFAQLEPLEDLTKRAKPDAVDVALALISISDGHFTEELLTMIAGSIDADAAVFLKALKHNHDRPFATCELAIDTGLDYVDDPKAELVVLEQRINKVEGINKPELEEVKQCVLTSLRDRVNAMKAHLK